MTDAQILLLLATRLRSRGRIEALSGTFVELGGDAASFHELLDEATRLGQVRVRGEEARWSLTGPGQAELAAHLAAEAERVGRADLTTAYEAFLPLNRRFLGALSDGAGLEPLADLVDELAPALASLTDQLPRFAGYGRRLDLALARAAADPRWIADPMIDSVHTIWFELHEHLLATLGRNRTQER